MKPPVFTMSTDPILTAVEQLREAAGNGPATRKLLDALFRHVHNLKARASANGLNKLAAAAHEVENVLHSMRTGAANTSLSEAVPADVWNSLKQEQKHTLQQSIEEGARLFLVRANFDVADFDQKFQSLKETLNKTGEVISTAPSIDNEHRGKINFRILYAQTGEADLSNAFDILVDEIPLPPTADPSGATNDLHALERTFEKLSAELINLTAVSNDGVLQQALRAGLAAALATGKEIDFEVRGEDLLLDQITIEPLIHLVRNAVDHGIEATGERVKLGKNPRGKIVIEAASVKSEIRIKVTDDGRGIDPALMQQIFRPGFSTATEISEISGRGVGLDAVKTAIEEAGGSVSVSSEAGHGASFELTLPKHPQITPIFKEESV